MTASSAVARFVAVLVAGVVLAACAANVGGRQADPGNGLAASARVARGSWIDTSAAGGDLLYATGADQGRAVHIFTYPQGKLIGSLTGFRGTGGECTDPAGDVFVVDSDSSEIYEFSHGSTTPLTTLEDRDGSPNNCAVDPASGDLAVANEYNYSPSGSGSVSIFKHARGLPKTYVDSKMAEMWFVTYDDQGNLFADGSQIASQGFRLAELQLGSGSFTEIKLNKTPKYFGVIQWDGQYLAVGDQDGDYRGFVIYRTSGRKIVDTVILNYPASYGTFFILGKTILHDYDGVQLYKYPAGGDQIKKLKLIGSAPSYVLVSRGTH